MLPQKVKRLRERLTPRGAGSTVATHRLGAVGAPLERLAQQHKDGSLPVVQHRRQGHLQVLEELDLTEILAADCFNQRLERRQRAHDLIRSKPCLKRLSRRTGAPRVEHGGRGCWRGHGGHLSKPALRTGDCGHDGYNQTLGGHQRASQKKWVWLDDERNQLRSSGIVNFKFGIELPLPLQGKCGLS